MIFNDFKSWAAFYRDLLRGYSREEQDWIGRYLVWRVLEARQIVDRCRESGEPLPPVLKFPEKSPAKSS